MTQIPINDVSDYAYSAPRRVIDTASSAHDLAAFGRETLERALALTTMASGSIWLYDQDSIICLAHCPARREAQPPRPNMAIRRVLETGQPDFDGARGAILPLSTESGNIGVLALRDAPVGPSHALLSAVGMWVAEAIERAQLTRQLEAQQRHSQLIKHQQDELIGIISHDLRNPMASIKGYADLLLRRSARIPDDPSRRGLEVISEQIIRMTGLLDQLLDISYISSERLRIDRRTDDLGRLVARVVTELRESTDRTNLELTGVEVAFPCAIDTARMRQAIRNVLANAVAYSPPESPIEVRLERIGEEAIIEIRDQGIGIPADEIERVFEPFFHASNATSRGSMGMGLFVAQQILMRHNGHIRCESAEGEGSIFYIALPLAAC